MARKKIADEKTAAEYLRYVLQNWSGFCDWHTTLARAITEILNENEQLKMKLEIISKISGGGTTPKDKGDLN